MTPSRPITVAAASAAAVAILGGAMTDIGPWYQSLEKSSLTPPDWAFGPAWTVIYALAAIVAVLGWRAAPSNRARALMVSLFFVNAVLNVLWSFFFFTVKRPDWAFAEVATLWVSVLALVLALWPHRREAAYCLTPYLVWVGYAAYLNYRVVVLNAPFGGA